MTLVFILFVILVIVILLPSQLTSQKDALQEVKESLIVRMDQLKKDFQFRTKELARRLQSEDLAEDEWQTLTDELQLDTRTSIDSTQVASQSDKTKASWLTATILIIVIVGLAYITYQFSGSYEQVKAQIEITDALKNDSQTIDKLTEKVQTDKSQLALTNLYLALRTKVELLPSNSYSWRTLAMFNSSYGRIKEARAAMKMAMKLEPKNLDLKIDLSQILSRSKEQQDLFYSRQLLSEVLKEEPENQDAMLLLGLSSYQFGMYKRAIDDWTKLLNITQPSSAMNKMVQQRIEKAQQMLSGEPAIEKVTESVKVAAGGAKLTVKVEIPDSVRAKLTGSEGLFIFVKAVNGPKFPIAVIRTTVADLAKEIVLTDANAMRPEFALSKYKEITVNARISFSGNAVAEAGDIQGTTEMISAPFPASVIQVVVDQPIK